MDKWSDLPWVEGQNTMGRGVNIPRIRGFYIPWVEGQNTIGREVKYHGDGVQYIMDRGFDILCVGDPIHHG